MELGLEKFLRDVRHRRDRFRQVIGAAFALALLATARPGGIPLILGTALCVLGESVRIWAAGYVRKDQQLETRGPYAFVRHPQYLGNTLLAVGLSLAGRQWWGLPFWALLFWLYYVPAIRKEDARLEKKFGESWRQWRRHTPAVIPRPPPRRALRCGEWSLRQCVRNGETLWLSFMILAFAYLHFIAP